MPPATLKDLELVFGKVSNMLLALGAFSLFIMLLIVGFKYLSSGGEPKALEQAQKTLTYAFSGLVLLIGSFLILTLIAQFTGTSGGSSANILQFTIFR